MLKKKRRVFGIGGSLAVTIPLMYRRMMDIRDFDIIGFDLIQASTLYALKKGKYKRVYSRAKDDEYVIIARNRGFSCSLHAPPRRARMQSSTS